MTNIRTFNAAKKFADEVLHPLIKNHSEAKLRTKLGDITINDAGKLSRNQRIFNRFNALKERMALQQVLLSEVEGTITLKGSIAEIQLITELNKQLDNIETNIKNNSNDIILEDYIDGMIQPVLTDLFYKVNSFLDNIYINLQQLMTKNNLLFSGDDDDFMDDQDLKEIIKIENRRS